MVEVKQNVEVVVVFAPIVAELKKRHHRTNYHKMRRLRLFAEYLLSFQLPSMPAVRVK